MIDQTTVNLLEIVGTPLKKVASTGGGEYHGPCPVCGGKDRFRVQPAKGRWACRQCSPMWGDAIAFIQWRNNVDFKTALAILGLNSSPSKPARRQTLSNQTLSQTSSSQTPSNQILSQTPSNQTLSQTASSQAASLGLDPAYCLRNDYECFTPAWQDAAQSFCKASYERLHSKEGVQAREWLLNRGIALSELHKVEIGYNPVDTKAQWGNLNVMLSKGIVIPWQFMGQYWRVNIRRPVGEPKYLQVAGGANGLYYGSPYHPGSPIEVDGYVVMTEGELDALAFRSNCVLLTDQWHIVSTGAASWARIYRWIWNIALAGVVFLAFDADKAGDEAAAWWASRLTLACKTIRLRPNVGKDVTDVVGSVGDLSEWVLDAWEAQTEVLMG